MNNFWLPTVPATDHQALRHFGLGMALVITMVFCVLLPWLFATPSPWWLAVVVLPLTVSAIFFPVAVYPVYRLWMVFASVMNYLNTRLLLGLVFFVVITPIGITLRLFRKLQYNRRPDSASKSFWTDRAHEPNEQHLREPF
ncbi:SxtJ family membrane protein [Alteromonas sp. ASW11-19]|uniref:SxtJ family membrane protein n=1 Tax=Alteromonas salexigens TaxID=2982530 RepID=A0ABT2VMC9_9ALTE|nr:SxtJ family membrane protein [Alteromonas salexigens]MCU7554250.1 SxtJ family membrane protein [Alteromonas salexigens]